MRRLPVEERPRERMLREGVEALSPVELVAILLTTGRRGESALDLAEKLLEGIGGLRYLSKVSLEEMSQFPGIGLAKAARLKAALELGKRVGTLEAHSRSALNSPAAVAEFLIPQMRYLEEEHFRALFLDTRHHLLHNRLISVGTLNASLVHPRELFREAVKRCAAAMILAHNHPSGDPFPSQEDLRLTKRLSEAGRVLGIEVLDHIIIGDNSFVSFREKGWL